MRQALAMLAGLLDRPNAQLRGCVHSCERRLGLVHPGLGRKLAIFGEWLKRASWFEIDEVYRATFDSDGWCPGTVTWHLFPPARRAAFLVRIEAYYRLQGFSPGGQLPDHVSTLLRFAAGEPQTSEADGIIDFCVRPALRRMRDRLEACHPYAAALDAVIMYLAITQRRKQPETQTASRSATG